MATIRKLRNKYQVIIKRGEYKHKPLVKTFAKKTLATLWANKIESQIDSGDTYDGRDIKNVLVADLLNRYKEEQVSTFARTSKESQGYIVKAMAKRFSDITLNLFDSKFIFAYGVKRLAPTDPDTKPIKADALIKELAILSGVFKFAKVSWGINVKQNEAVEARSMLNTLGYLKGANIQKKRRVSDDEYTKIRQYQTRTFTPAKYAFLLAIETGMRTAELVGMQWDRVYMKEGYYQLESEKSDYTKKTNEKGRVVPLTLRAGALLRLVRYIMRSKGKLTNKVWTWQRADSLTNAMRRFCERTGIKGLSMHSFRHEFGGMQADNDVDIRISSAAMGHSDLRSVQRYTKPDMIKNAHKIKGRTN
jgi:integrase